MVKPMIIKNIAYDVHFTPLYTPKPTKNNINIYVVDDQKDTKDKTQNNICVYINIYFVHS